MDNVFVTKLVNGGISYKIPGKNGFRTWKGENSKLRIKYEELEECVFDPSIKKLFIEGYLFIEDKDTRIALGLEAAEGENLGLSVVLNKTEVIELLYKKSFEEFVEIFNTLGTATKELILDVAINTKATTDVEKYDFLQKTFQVDIEAIRKAKRAEG